MWRIKWIIKMVKDAYLRMKLSNNCKCKELLSIWNGVLWCYKEPILTSEDRKIQLNQQIQHCPPMLTFMQAVLCSSLQLWIAVLTKLTDSVWQLVISRQHTSKHDLCVALKFPLSGSCRSTAVLCPVCGLPRRSRVYRKVFDTCWCRGQSAGSRRGTDTH